ncbi:MAG: ribonuclease T2 [Phyllobacteriaceae bacterium]|nr:ribonuclease T2 [Phyllobacteriaceae bacterium]
MSKLAAFALAVVVTLLGVLPAAAQSRGRPGDFDFWVLSLSWSPSWCEATGAARGDAQCARPFAFVVHGLWPQWQRGFPSDCPTGEPGPSRADVDGVLDVMPSPGLVRHEWRTHGTCSGLSARTYFSVIRKLSEKIRIPDEYKAPDRPRLVDTRGVETAFMATNKGLDADEISIFCSDRRLQEVRVCLKKDLSAFAKCPEVERRDCRSAKVYMPAVR